MCLTVICVDDPAPCSPLAGAPLVGSASQLRLPTESCLGLQDISLHPHTHQLQHCFKNLHPHCVIHYKHFQQMMF